MADALILAGGLGTRLRGLWDGPKCLIPVGGVPLLARLFDRLHAAGIQRAILALGAHWEDVERWLRSEPRPIEWNFVIDRHATFDNTALAFRDAVGSVLPRIRTPLLVLNGDTLPLYALQDLLRFHNEIYNTWATVAMVQNVHEWRQVYAGTCVLSARAIEEICADKRTHDFQAHLLGALQYSVPGFLDVGTPEGFQRAKEWRE